MPPAEARAAAPMAGRPHRTGKGLLWAMLAALVILAAVAVVAMLGWDTAIHRADQQTTRAAALQAAADQATGLQQKVATLQQDLADAQGHEQTLRAQFAEIKAVLTQAQGKAAAAAAAEERAAVAEKAASDAERTRAELQAELNAARSASNISAATAQSDVAPELPLPGLPPGATPRDYLVAAQQAVRAGSAGRAQAALERAETRMLNEASLTRDPAHPASHPGIAEVEHALDQLGNGDTEGVLRTIDGLLMRR